MSSAPHLGLWLLALSLSFNGPVLALPKSVSSAPTVQNSADETALRALAEAFFKTWAAKDLDGFLRLWSARSPELEARRKADREFFANSDQVELRGLTIRAVKLDGDKARVRVEADAQVIEAQTGKEKAGYGKMPRTLECVKEEGHWKVWREASAFDEFAAALAEAKSDQERAALLAEEKEFVTAELVRALGGQGDRFYDQGSYPQALAIHRLAQGIAEQIGDQPGIARTLRNIGNIHISQGDYAKALEVFRRGLELNERLQDKAGIARSLGSLGIVYGSQGDYARALEYYGKCLKQFEAMDDQTGIARTLGNIAVIQDNQGDYAQSLESNQRSLLLFEAKGDKAGSARTLNNIGLTYAGQGNYAKALGYYQQSLRLKEVLGDKTGAANTLIGIGNIHTEQGNYAQALEYFRQSLAMKETLGDKAGIALALDYIGVIYNLQGDDAQALEYFQKSLAINEAIGDKAVIGDTLNSIGIVHNRHDNYTRALENFRKSLAIAEALGEKAGIAIRLSNIGIVHRSQGNYAQALEFAEHAATIARSIGASETLWESLTTASRAYWQLNKPVEARQALEEAITIIETLRTQVAGGEEEQQRFFQSKVSPYHAMADLLTREGRPAEALTFAERAKSRVLLDVLQAGRVNVTKALTGEEQEQERKLRAELISLNTQATSASQQEKPDQAKLGELQVLREKARLNYEAFQTSLYAAHPELKVQRGEAPAIKAEELAALLPDAGNALLEYVVTDEVTYLFTVTKAAGNPAADVQVFTLPIKRDELTKQTENFRRQLAGRDLGFRASARGLYQLLLKPAQAQLRGKTNLVIVPDDKLWELPFQALLAEGNRYVIETCAVSYAPSLTVLREMKSHREKRRVDAASSALLALGNPAIGRETIERATLTLRDGKLDPLPGAEQEVKALGRLYGAARSKVYVGAEAREDRAKTEAAQARILHFATHGVLNDASPMYSHLVLAQGDKNEDGLLEAWELMQLDLRADLAVLSACETARGRFGAGEGVIGLSWAMFVAGVPATLVSQWKVESASTRDLMLNFHRRLQAPSAKAEVTKAEALRQAALKLIKNSATSHPFYWAGFVLVGDGR
ncbi:MAG: tetratricopeptide repeat protein [Blastocatellia bacterium]